MPRVTILPAEAVCEASPGDTLLDAGHKAGVEMEAGCFNCSCGTCVVEVVTGANHLEPPSDEELDVLDAWSRDPDRFRLACAARVATGDVSIRQLD
ncbi:MAG: (2Fe-2S)-binding protein [Verrucomicrobiales bacterium]|nr:(2Fe-2S)-binding protein [Verrucomicrobiales bacterium]